MVRHAAAKLVPPSYSGATRKGDKDKKDEKKNEDRSYEASQELPPSQAPARVGSLALGGGKGKDVISYCPRKGPAASGEGGLTMTVPVPKVIPAAPSSSSSLEVCGVALVSYRPEMPGDEQKNKEFKDRVNTKPDERKDKPPNYKKTRGDKRKAMAAAQDDQLMADAMKNYVTDWKSAGDTTTFYIKTWHDLHAAHWDGVRRPADEVLPLTPIKIHVVGALLKEGGYRGPGNYMTAMKNLHIEHGRPFSQVLELAAKRFNMSVSRGIGPPRQSEPLNIELILGLSIPCDPLVRGGPMNSLGVANLCTYFMVRELEAALARRRHITLNEEEQKVTWTLPVTKTDPEALGCSRDWGCICLVPDANNKKCPFHAAKYHMQILRDSFGDITEDDDLPLFPQEDGQEVSAEAFIRLIEELAARTGESIKTPDGRNRFGKHSWRSTGAVYLSTVGIEVFKIQLLARWSSPIVTHYTRLAPLKTLAKDFKHAAALKLGAETSARSKANEGQLKKMRAILTKEAKKWEEEFAKLNELIDKVKKEAGPPRYLLNTVTGAIHQILLHHDWAGINARTFCGWEYARSKASVLPVKDHGHDRELICDTCMSEVRAALA